MNKHKNKYVSKNTEVKIYTKIKNFVQTNVLTGESARRRSESHQNV